MKRLEAICDAVAYSHGYFEPESEAYELRNPGLLLVDDGKRIFSCHKAGYAALFDRVQKDCRTHPDASLSWLLDSFGIKMKMQKEHAIDYIARCANSNGLKLETPLKWFIDA